MKYTFVGDIHGSVSVLRDITKDGSNLGSIIQVGDFGVGFRGPEWDQKADQFNIENGIRFIRGNHDYPEGCKGMESWIEDGHHENGVMFVGGAWSIDHHYRTPGISWWHDEELSDKEFAEIEKKYREVKPNLMITHDCPHSVAKKIFEPELGFIKETRTSFWLEEMLKVHRPKLWIFGHRHLAKDEVIDGTRFVCLDINKYVTFDTEDLK